MLGQQTPKSKSKRRACTLCPLVGSVKECFLTSIPRIHWSGKVTVWLSLLAQCLFLCFVPTAQVSFGAAISPPPGRGPPVFRVHGAVYHASVALDPDAQAGGKYAQLYLYESGEALHQRSLQHPRLSEEVLNDLQGMLEEESPFVATYRTSICFRPLLLCVGRVGRRFLPLTHSLCWRLVVAYVPRSPVSAGQSPAHLLCTLSSEFECKRSPG